MENIKGMINEIIFKNEDNGYTVATLETDDDEITIVGCLPTLSLGETIKVTGKWINHKIYGPQFEVESFMIDTPSSVDGIIAYLSSGMIKGVGPKIAEKIVQKFGVDTINIIQSNPDLLTQIDGIGRKKAEQIGKSFEKERELRNLIINLAPYGIGPNICFRIYKKYKNNSIKIVTENPYKLAQDIKGIGFKLADDIAKKLGISPYSKDRIAQGIIYTLKQSTSEGHTFLPKNILVNKAKEILNIEESYIKDEIISLALDNQVQIEKENVYLIPYYISENGVCKKIIQLASYEFEDLQIDIDEKINEIEKDENITLAQNQKKAIKEAIKNGVFVLTGGPGTGKTTTINTIIRIFESINMKVVLAAPTGRAAKRMSETTNKQAKTIHRLLEMGYSQDDEELVFMKNEDDPLDADVVIIDEVSMVDIILMYNLLKGIKLGTKVILVGDSDQLPSVGAGNVLKDIISSNIISCVKLDEIFRQSKESMIIVNAHKINKGESVLLNQKNKDFYFIQRTENEDILNEILNLVDKRIPNYYKIDKLKDIQILSPMRKGDLGVINLNNMLQNILNPKSKFKNEEIFQNRIFRVGDKVMQIKNNYNKKWETCDQSEKGEGVYNGDIGYIYEIDKEERIIYVIFDENKIAKYEYSELDELEHSFCTTIHKSQGSEFPVVIMPICWAPPMLLSRNLLYTGVTRAKKLVVLVGDIKYLDFMIKNNRIYSRYSNLKNKLSMFRQEGLID
ncbi:exodeoxyribonuclease V alpha subunit [Alkalithermobacter thermoalcaliphilus JW-YL-7 = DSM 7308]|uniref:ATP-dependent RecD2 DNA helicase n=1 Tax=Alkalithermobacter thermoalcaliphilus JW-YL-7 = DSM 7308 TaxID=1121328 RepID=A0A150FN58_CLOPD|nr:helicase, RecD/TraA family [[Clostridium] paradoxum JW-YL-7 = DSM 7308]SHL05585.1 exodeoxyribonuclease V alpha subunit [[Clostridium] paradoxum JW-YL-7 = DSM 7308]